ncbi:site-specific DNA-methyltransferase, partial [Campylobacter jejuni]|nr:site-specific DNA-methyltransferase [Campylobacter jejuni]
KKILNLYPKDTIDHRNLMFEELDIFLKENMISEKKYNDIKSKIDSGEYFLQQYKDTKFHLICSYQDDNLSKMYSIFSGHWTSDGNEEIESIFNGKLVFENPKPTTLIKEIFFANTNQNDIILDFFAGSGTTAQAVMELNAEDNGNRKFILVQLDEKIDENKSKVAYDFCKNELGSENPVISDITIERVKRAGEKILKENRDKNLDLGFKVFSLVEKPELTKDELNTLNLKYHENLSPYEKALNLALLNGKTLDKDLKMILKDKLYECEDCFYIVNCDDEVLEFLRKTQNENVYINGYDDINLEDYLNLESFLKERLKMVY